MSVEQMLKGLQKDYINSLPDKIADIQKFVRDGATADLRNSFHKLKGTGQTYGIPEITQLAATMENICLHSPAKLPTAAKYAISILMDISTARRADKDFDIKQDPRFLKLSQ
ncbi:MAG: Hpt domain-containing protein [Bdellovibrionales bacterium]